MRSGGNVPIEVRVFPKGEPFEVTRDDVDDQIELIGIACRCRQDQTRLIRHEITGPKRKLHLSTLPGKGGGHLLGEVLAQCRQMARRMLRLKGCYGVQIRFPLNVRRRYGTQIVLKIYSFRKSYFG